MYIKNKSVFNIDAAKMLIDETLYSPSVHCSYYGCFQLMKYKLNSTCGCSYDDITSKVTASKQTKHPISEHVCVRQEMERHLREKINARELRTVIGNIKDLYNFRITSDYINEEIDYSKATKALGHAEDIISTINKNIK